MDEFEKLQVHLGRLAPFIGYLVISFNSLEDSLDTIIVDYINDRDATMGYSVILGLSFSSKLDLLNRMVSYELNYAQNQRYIDKFQVIIGLLREANNSRNEIIHAAWLEYDINSGTVKTRSKIRPEGVQHQTKTIQLKDIKKTIRSYESLETKLNDLFEDRARWWTRPSYPRRAPISKKR